MIRRIAIILGLAWSFLFASLLVKETIGCLRSRELPPRESWGALALQLLLYGTMAVLSFAVSAALKRPSDGKDAREGGGDQGQGK